MARAVPDRSPPPAVSATDIPDTCRIAHLRTPAAPDNEESLADLERLNWAIQFRDAIGESVVL